MFKIVEAPIASDALYGEVLKDYNGAVVTFCGVVRNHSGETSTDFLVYDAYKEMAEKESNLENGIEVVAIVTPNHLHYPIAEAFINKGIHVVCDKPLTHNLEDAEKFFSNEKNFSNLINQEYEKLNIKFSIIILRDYKISFDKVFLQTLKDFNVIPDNFINNVSKIIFSKSGKST